MKAYASQTPATYHQPSDRQIAEECAAQLADIRRLIARVRNDTVGGMALHVESPPDSPRPAAA